MANTRSPQDCTSSLPYPAFRNSRDIAATNLSLRRFINNEFVKGVDGKTFEVINPTNEEVITSVHEATEKDVDIAVAAARKAFEGPWKKVTPGERGRLLTKLADLIEKNLDLLASVEALDNGKSMSMAKGDVGAVAGCIRYYGGWADKIEGKVIDTNPDTFTYTRQEPVRIILNPEYGSYLKLIPGRLVSAHKLSPGTFHCSCGHGRLVPQLRPVTPSFSRPLNKLHSPPSWLLPL